MWHPCHIHFWNKTPLTVTYNKNRNTLNHYKPLSSYYDFSYYDDDKEVTESIALFKLCSVSNPKANLKALRAILDQHKNEYEVLKMRLLGEFISLSGLIYGRLFNNEHVIPPFYELLELKKKRQYLCLLGCDPHETTNTAAVFLLVDRENNCYLDRCYWRGADTGEIKDDIAEIIRENNYRMGFSVLDKSANSSIIAFGGRNIYMELTRGKNAFPAPRESNKFTGSIHAGVDAIKKRLKLNEISKKPSFFIVDRPENKLLIQAFRSLERDTYPNEDKKGMKDRILEGKHHHHAALRYIFQFPINWYPEITQMPEPELEERYI